VRDAATSRLLFDTQLLLWWAVGSPRLPAAARTILEAPYGPLAASVISFWEIAIKRSKGKLDADPVAIRIGLAQRTFDFLPVDVSHVDAFAALPRLHGDPFDRMLIAQAEAEGMTLLTADERLRPYGKRVRVV
jgi:PIN domain nuclease of toxin-antitoxin system